MMTQHCERGGGEGALYWCWMEIFRCLSVCTNTRLGCVQHMVGVYSKWR